MATKKFPFYRQLDFKDCGPTCLRMIAKFHGKTFSREFLREKAHITKEGVNLAGIAEAAEEIQLRTLGMQVSLQSLVNEVPTPFIVPWRQKHFVVVHKTTKDKIFVADPAFGLLSYTHEKFMEAWTSKGKENGFVLILEPNTKFYGLNDVNNENQGFKFIIPYLKPYKSLVYQLLIGLFVGGVIQLIFPFLMQSVVDFGIQNQNINFIYLILIAQIVLFLNHPKPRFEIGKSNKWIHQCNSF